MGGGLGATVRSGLLRRSAVAPRRRSRRGDAAAVLLAFALTAGQPIPAAAVGVHQQESPAEVGQVSAVEALPGAGQIALTWTNPAVESFAGVMVRMTTGPTAPATPEEGTLLYEGTDESATATGLTSGTTYSFAFFTYDSTPTYGDAVVTTATTPAATSLSIARSTGTVVYRQPVTLSGRLTRAGTTDGVADAVVTLYHRRRNTTTWTPLRSVTTSTTGGWTVAAKPSWHIEYTARYDGSVDFLGARSGRRAVLVRARLSAGLSTTRVKLGRAATLGGTVAPNHHGRTVLLQRYHSGAWQAQSSAVLSASSTYSFRIRPRAYGIYRYRVVLRADSDHLGTTSTSRRLQAYARTYSYAVCFRGTITANKRRFADHVAMTYGHAKGWARAGKRFVRVKTDCSLNSTASDLRVWLAAAETIPRFPGCYDRNYSCRSGNNVVINQKRWQKGATARGWDIGLTNYRSHVLNHETGHYYYLRHRSCPGAGRLAPVMQQQSVRLNGCRPNPWPTAPEVRAAAAASR